MARILVIDDEQLIGRVFQRAIKDHDVDVAWSAWAGLRLHAQHRYPLAFVDMHLPDADGADVAAELVRMCPLHIVLISGDLEDASVPEPAWEILRKPFSMAQLLACIARLDI